MTIDRQVPRRKHTYLDLVKAVAEADPILADAAMRARDVLGLSAAALREEFRLDESAPLPMDATLRMAELMMSVMHSAVVESEEEVSPQDDDDEEEETKGA